MSARDYYSLPQASRQHQSAITREKQLVKGDNIHQKIADRKDNCTFTQKHLYVLGIEVVAFAYIICLYIILEGVVILYNENDHHFTDLIRGPFAEMELFVLTAAAYGDILAGSIGITGLWLGSNLLHGWRRFAPMHNWLATTFVTTVIVWRGLVCLVFAPWVGVFLAFAVPEHDRFYPYLLALFYVLWAIWIMYILIMAFKEISNDTRQFQLHLNQQRLHEREFLLRAAANARLEGNAHDGEAMHDHELEPHLFGVLPLSETVTIYAVVNTIAMLMSFVHVFFTGETAGGWAFFAPTPEVVQTYTMELFLYPVCFVCGAIGILGTATFGGFGFLEAKSALSAILVFLASASVRFALMFAVTGMDLIERNECGVYVNGVARMASAPRTPWGTSAQRNNAMLHCTPASLIVLALTFIFMCLDAYMLWGTFQMHHHAVDWLVGEPGYLNQEETALERWMETEGALLSGADQEAAEASRY